CSVPAAGALRSPKPSARPIRRWTKSTGPKASAAATSAGALSRKPERPKVVLHKETVTPAEAGVQRPASAGRETHTPLMAKILRRQPQHHLRAQRFVRRSCALHRRLGLVKPLQRAGNFHRAPPRQLRGHRIRIFPEHRRLKPLNRLGGARALL